MKEKNKKKEAVVACGRQKNRLARAKHTVIEGKSEEACALRCAKASEAARRVLRMSAPFKTYESLKVTIKQEGY